MHRFASPWDRALRVSTLVFGGVLVAAAVAVAVAIHHAGDGELDALAALPSASLLAVLAVTWALAPRAFSLAGGALVVERPLRPVRIPLASVETVDLLPGPALRRCLRVGGVSGLFGHYGRFWSPSLGSFRAYATRSSDLVRVGTKGGVFVLSPVPAAAFVDALLARAPRAVRSPGAPAGRLGGARLAAGIVLASLGLVLLTTGGTLAASWAWAPRSIRVVEGAVLIERQRAAPLTIPLSEIRSAEPLHPRYARGWVRRSGVGLGRWRYGRWSSRELGRFRLYANRDGPYVLVDTAAGRWVLTPDDPPAFLAALRDRGG